MKQIMQQYKEMYDKLSPEIEANIEKYRKGDFTVSVTDEQGNPVQATITARQIGHEFDFGTNVLMLGAMGDDEQKYRDAITNIFNFVTTTLCWSITEYEKGKFRFDEGVKDIYRRPPLERVLRFAKENGLKCKAQPLLADSWYPDWASREEEELKEEYIRYFKKVAERYDGKYDLIDVVNESYYAPKRTPHYPLLKDGEFGYVKWALKTAGEIFSDQCVLERNEGTEVNYSMADRYYAENKEILESGIRLDSIGHQFHLFTGASCIKNLLTGGATPDVLYKNYLRESTLNVPMYISEVTIPTVYEGVSLQEGEEVQAEILDRLYRLWFSIPNMRGIVYWNLKDGDAWLNEGSCKGCLIDEYMRKKKSYYVIEHLIKREWNTSLKQEADGNGNMSFRGFYGNYELTVEVDGKTVKQTCLLGKNSPSVSVIVK